MMTAVYKLFPPYFWNVHPKKLCEIVLIVYCYVMVKTSVAGGGNS